MHGTAGEKSRYGVDRRSLLRIVSEGAALWFFWSFRWGLTAYAARGGDSASSPSSLTAKHKRLAALGEALETSDPGAAERLYEFVRTEATRRGLGASQMKVADRLSSLFLSEARVRSDFRNGHLQPVEG